jgi:hypothetical protein
MFIYKLTDLLFNNVLHSIPYISTFSQTNGVRFIGVNKNLSNRLTFTLPKLTNACI